MRCVTIHTDLIMTAENANKSDLPQLKTLWEEAFGNTDTDEFFDFWFSSNRTVVCRVDERITAASYILPAGEIVNGDDKLSCAMIYGVAAKKEYRGYGFGAFVTDTAVEYAAGLGYRVCALCPADYGLFNYYKKYTKFCREYFIGQKTYESFEEELQQSYEFKSVSAGNYRVLRRKFLNDRVYLDLNERFVEYQNNFSDGKGLVKICRDGECVGTAVLEQQDKGRMWIKELLCVDNMDRIVAELAQIVGVEQCVVRYPIMEGRADGHRFILTPEIDIPQNAWFGLALD